MTKHGFLRHLGVALVVLFLTIQPALAKKILGSHDGLESCGDDVIAARTCPTCDADPAFELEGYWHKLAQCTRDIRDLWSKQGPDYQTSMPGNPTVAQLARAQIVQEMTRPHVVFVSADDRRAMGFSEVFDRNLAPLRPFSQVMLTNDLGVPYNGMGQSGLAYALYQLAARADKGGYAGSGRDAAFFHALARGAVQTVLAPVERGGLASIRPCDLAPSETCIWFHSITRRDRQAEAGGTLNQMLHVVRDLGGIARFTAKQRWNEPLDFAAAAEGGLNQMFLSSGVAGRAGIPNLADFISDQAGPNGAHWAYYGFNMAGSGPERGYFLKNSEKNCSYHVHVLQLLDTILEWAHDTGRGRTALERAFAPGAALPQFMQAADDASRRQVTSQIVCPVRSSKLSQRVNSDLERLRRQP
jgi:hypothetical protein